MVDWCTIRRRRPRRRVGAGPFFLGWNNQQLTVRRSRCWVTPHATFPRSSLHRIAPTPFPHTSTTTYSRRQPAAAMSEQGQEEFRVLFAAAEKGRADIINTSVEALKKSGLFSVEEEEGDGTAVLAGSTSSDREAVISRLRDSDGASPLHLASKNGHVDATRALLRLGAYPQVLGSGPLARKTPWDVANAVVRQVYVNELFSQVAQGNASRVLALLKAGVASSVCEGVPRGDTPLHWAASYGHVKLCALLLSEGAELNHRNDEGATPLHEASRGGHASVVRFLLERGADTQIGGSGGAFEGKIPIQMSLTETVFEVFRSNPPPFEPPQQPLRSIDVLSQGSVMEDRSLAGSSTVFAGEHQREVESVVFENQSLRGSFDEKSDTTASGSNGIGDLSGHMVACNGHAGNGSTSQGKEGTAVENTALRTRLGPSSSAEENGSSGLSRTPVEESKSCLDSEELLWRESLSRTPDLPYTGIEYGNEAHSNGGPVGGHINEKYDRSLPMLWPPPRACTVLRSEVCRVPPKVTLVLPMNGIAGPGTHTLEILLEALMSKGVTATCTRGACPSVGENKFVVALACGRLQRACATTASTTVTFGGQGYSLVATEGTIRVTGAGEAGLYYGVSTLCQILGFYAHQSHIGAEKVAVEIPCCIIKDEPDVARRSLVLDLRYPLVPTMASMMRTLEAASQARLNVVQLTLTLETASWMLDDDHRDTNEPTAAKGTPNSSGGKEGENVLEGGIKTWGWGALGKLEAFCERRFVDFVLGWSIVPGDESRDAQRKMMHLLPLLSRQFKSDEMHIAFDEGVRLTWDEHTEEEASESTTNRDLEVGDRLASDVDRLQTEALSPYRLLNNLIASCNKSTIVFEGMHPGAIASLQRVGCPPVELAFTVAAEVLSDNRALGAFSRDSIVDVVSDGLSMLLGPASVGYVSTALSGAGAGKREQACLSVHRALVDVASGVAEARHTGCGVQIRPRPIPASPFTPLPHSEHVAPLHPMSAETELPACGGINPYFPTLLSDIVVFFGAGLCWGLEKTNSAANLPMVAGDVPRGVRAALGRGRFESTSGRGANGAAMGTDVQTLHGSPRPALFLVEHVLEIDSGTIPPASMSQLCDCLETLMEDWNPFMSNSLDLRFPPLALGGRQEEETDLLQKVDDVIWGMHAPGRKDGLNFVLSADNRYILKALQIRHLDIQAASKLVTTNLNALKGPSAEMVLALFSEIARTARLLKLSGRLLQTIFFHVLGPDVRGSSKNRSLRNSYPPSPPVMPSPRSGRRRSDQNGKATRPIQNWPHSTGSYVYSESASGEENALPEWVKRLPLLARMDAINRYLDELGALSRAWDSETFLPSGKAVLLASLSGLLGLLADDMPVEEVKTLCKHAIYK